MNTEEGTAEEYEDDDDSNYETGFHSDSYDIIVHEIIVKADFDSKSSKHFLQDSSSSKLRSLIFIYTKHIFSVHLTFLCLNWLVLK